MRTQHMPATVNRLGCFALALIGAYLAHQLERPDVLLVGPVTIDVVPDGSRPAGGSITYAAAVLNSLGIRACVVTVAGPDADLSVFAPHELHVVQSKETLTFEHTYTWWSNSRHLRVTADPNVTLSRRHVPRHCQRARLVVLGPLTLHDVDAGSFLTHDSVWDHLMRGPWQRVVYMAQGAQRQLGARGAVMSLGRPSQVLMAGLGRQVSVFLSEVETAGWPADDLARVAGRVERLVITKGEEGAQEWNKTGVHQIDALPVDPVVDTNGAGDTYAVAYGIALAWGLPDPGSTASYAAGLAVQQPQSCKPACVGAGWAHLAQPWPLRVKLWVDLTGAGPHLAAVAAAAGAPVAAVVAARAGELWERVRLWLPAEAQPIWPMRGPGGPPPPLPVPPGRDARNRARSDVVHPPAPARVMTSSGHKPVGGAQQLKLYGSLVAGAAVVGDMGGCGLLADGMCSSGGRDVQGLCCGDGTGACGGEGSGDVDQGEVEGCCWAEPEGADGALARLRRLVGGAVAAIWGAKPHHVYEELYPGNA